LLLILVAAILTDLLAKKVFLSERQRKKLANKYVLGSLEERGFGSHK
jgi:hypothetical protein